MTSQEGINSPDSLLMPSSRNYLLKSRPPTIPRLASTKKTSVLAPFRTHNHQFKIHTHDHRPRIRNINQAHKAHSMMHHTQTASCQCTHTYTYTATQKKRNSDSTYVLHALGSTAPMSWIGDVSVTWTNFVSTTCVLRFPENTVGTFQKYFACVSWRYKNTCHVCFKNTHVYRSGTKILSMCVWVQKYLCRCHADYLGKSCRSNFETRNTHDPIEASFPSSQRVSQWHFHRSYANNVE